MAGFVVAMTVALFLGGTVTGVVIAVALAVRREDRRNTLAGAAPGLLASSVRRLNGVGRRGLDAEFLRPTVR